MILWLRFVWELEFYCVLTIKEGNEKKDVRGKLKWPFLQRLTKFQCVCVEFGIYAKGREVSKRRCALWCILDS